MTLIDKNAVEIFENIEITQSDKTNAWGPERHM